MIHNLLQSIELHANAHLQVHLPIKAVSCPGCTMALHRCKTTFLPAGVRTDTDSPVHDNRHFCTLAENTAPGVTVVAAVLYGCRAGAEPVWPCRLVEGCEFAETASASKLC